MMRDKTIKLLYFSLRDSEAKEIVLGWKRILSLLFAGFVVLLLLVGSSLALFTDFYQNKRIEQLKLTNSNLKANLVSMVSKVDVLEKRMHSLEKENDDLRIFADMEPINKDIRQVGVGGTAKEEAFDGASVLPSELSSEIGSVHSALEQLERRIQLFVEDRNEIMNTLSLKQETYKHLPSIRPILKDEGRLSDRFGYRIDPFTDIKRHHDGIDISARIGTKVHAAAAGIVIKAITSYTPGHGYGKEVVIDHGNGMRTRYAHLSKVLVKKGQKVKRWEVIGKVGRTGRTTGPHLHYEVLVNNKPVNPAYYIFQ